MVGYEDILQRLETLNSKTLEMEEGRSSITANLSAIGIWDGYDLSCPLSEIPLHIREDSVTVI